MSFRYPASISDGRHCQFFEVLNRPRETLCMLIYDRASRANLHQRLRCRVSKGPFMLRLQPHNSESGRRVHTTRSYNAETRIMTILRGLALIPSHNPWREARCALCRGCERELSKNYVTNVKTRQTRLRRSKAV